MLQASWGYKAIHPENFLPDSDFSGIRLSEDGLFHGISDDARQRLAGITESHYFRPGELILPEGYTPHEMAVLVEGRALLVAGRGHARKEIRIATEHEVFGVTEMLGHSPFDYSLEALSPCRVDTITSADFEAFLRDEEIPRSRLTRFLSIAVQLRSRIAR